MAASKYGSLAAAAATCRDVQGSAPAAMPAGEIETVVVEQLRQVLRSPEVLAQAVHEVTALRPRISEPEAIAALQSIDEVWDQLFPGEQARIAHTLIDRVTVRKDGISIAWKTDGMPRLLRDTVALEAA
ncbi:MAG: hypothetical protein VW339_14015 [Quisquiliibacterium sp.]